MEKKATRKHRKGFSLGYNLDPHGLLHCPIARNMLPVRQVLYDTCHNYFANGIGSQEIILFQEALTKHTAVTREAIQKSVCEVDWKCSLDKLNSQAARKKIISSSLFHWHRAQGIRYPLLVLVAVANASTANNFSALHYKWPSTVSSFCKM